MQQGSELLTRDHIGTMWIPHKGPLGFLHKELRPWLADAACRIQGRLFALPPWKLSVVALTLDETNKLLQLRQGAP